MHVRFVRPHKGALDHEVLWASVAVTALGGAITWLRLGGLPPLVCPFHWLTGLPCPTCGSTRALAALATGELGASLRFNPAVLPACIAAVGYVLYAAVVLAFGLPRVRFVLADRDRHVARWGVIAAAALVWCFLIIEGV